MAKAISEYTDKSQLKTIMENAKRLGKQDTWWEAFRRVCELEGLDQHDPLNRDFYETLAAYEGLLTEKNGKTTKASYTRRKLKNKGVIQCLEDWAVSATPTDGFDLLIENGMAELTGEYLVLKYPEHFSETARSAAKARLEKLGVTLPNT